MDIIKTLADELSIGRHQAEAAVKLIDEGNTIPFIARYRKEATGSLNDEVLRTLDERLKYLRGLQDRKKQVIATITDQGKMTAELERQILSAATLVAVEDLYRPYKPKRRTRAAIAHEKGLEPLADLILLQAVKEPVEQAAASYISGEKGVETAEDAVQGAMDILAERISDNAVYRTWIRNMTMNKGLLQSAAKDESVKSVYETYYNYEEPVKKAAGHRILALNRGEGEKILSVKVVPLVDQIVGYLEKQVITRDNPYTSPVLKTVVKDSYDRLIGPSVEREIRSEITEKAEEGAIRVFGKNLEQLLMQPPISGRVVLGWDPAFRTGCKLAVVDSIQRSLYAQFKEDKSCSVAMNPYTGEVLALVSTPSYDNNDFILGLSNEQWTALNDDETKPMYNRFRQVWCPGSTFKPIIAAIGLESGAIDPMEEYGNEGLSWQKDSSWGSYYVTTLHTYEPVILENALIYSDNIYFAKAALKIGAEEMERSLTELGFNEEIPFDIKMAKSQYSNTENIETEIQLADSGYGQGQVLINPLHMACIYSAFCNEGNIVKPYLVYQAEATVTFWKPGAFSKETANQVLEGTKKVVNDSHGTGHAPHRDDIVLAGKTGTAEIKTSKDDTSGTELGWFAIYSTEETVEHPILIISMVEDVKGRGGSGYVVKKDSAVLEDWFHSN